MSEQQDQQPVFSIEKIYVKDLSLEIPHAPQVFLGRVGGAKAQGARNFGPGGRCAGAGNRVLDKIQNLLLPWGEGCVLHASPCMDN